MPHESWITVWTHGSGIVAYGHPYTEDRVHHFSLDVEELQNPLHDERGEKDFYLGSEHRDVYRGEGDFYHVSGKITANAKLPKEFGPDNLVALAVLDMADSLPVDLKAKLIDILQAWIERIRNLPSQVVPSIISPASGPVSGTVPTPKQAKPLAKEMEH